MKTTAGSDLVGADNSHKQLVLARGLVPCRRPSAPAGEFGLWCVTVRYVGRVVQVQSSAVGPTPAFVAHARPLCARAVELAVKLTAARHAAGGCAADWRLR